MSANTGFEKLLEPHHIGPVRTRNRLIKTGATTLYWHQDELHMNQTTLAYYEAIARGGVGLLIVESPTIDYPSSSRWSQIYRLDGDEYIEGLSELVQVIHKHGCPTFMQMVHLGPWQNPLFPNEPPVSDLPPVGASPVKLDAPGDFQRDLIRPLTIPEIEEIVDKWANAAVRAQKAGFDGVDINAGSTHLMHNFLSPFWNRREDAYGGSRENRARFLVEIIREIKNRCGRDFPVCITMNGIEVGRAVGVDDDRCMTVEDSQGLAKIIEAAGADAIQVRNQWLGYHVGGFLPDYLFYPEPPIPLEKFPKKYNSSLRGAGANICLAEGLKNILSIPVIVVGRLDPELGERYLREGKADFIAMTRRIFADPELPNKVAAGRLEDITPCTACGTCLDQSIQMKRRCQVNAAIATEKYTIDKAEKRKRVVVVGGGPAGMEAARVAAIRGHEVTLYEKSSKLGGLLHLAALIKGIELEDLLGLVRYLTTQLDKLGVRTKLGQEVNSALIEEIKPDVVIVATGGTPTVPKITGIDHRKVVTTPALHRQVKPLLRLFGPRILGWLTKLWLPIGKTVVIIGSGLHGCETAEFLIKRGRKVTMVDTAETAGEGMLDFRLGLFLDWYDREGGVIITAVQDMEITDQGLVITTKDGEKLTLPADSIVPTGPLAPDTELLESLEGKAPEIYAIGDCQQPRMTVDAIADGWRIANRISIERRCMMTAEELEKRLQAAEHALKELEKRVRFTEDIQEIHELQRRYVNALICTEWDDCADCFAENGKIDVYLHEPVTGNDNIRKWFKEELSITHAGKEGDVLVHPVIEVDGDTAKGKWLLYMMYCYPRTGQSLFWVQGFYDMEYVRENGEWKISYMSWTERMGLPGTGPPEGLW